MLGVIYIRLGGRTLLWDAGNMKVSNLSEANNSLHYEYRKGWTA